MSSSRFLEEYGISSISLIGNDDEDVGLEGTLGDALNFINVEDNVCKALNIILNAKKSYASYHSVFYENYAHDSFTRKEIRLCNVVANAMVAPDIRIAKKLICGSADIWDPDDAEFKKLYQRAIDCFPPEFDELEVSRDFLWGGWFSSESEGLSYALETMPSPEQAWRIASSVLSCEKFSPPVLRGRSSLERPGNYLTEKYNLVCEDPPRHSKRGEVVFSEDSVIDFYRKLTMFQKNPTKIYQKIDRVRRGFKASRTPGHLSDVLELIDFGRKLYAIPKEWTVPREDEEGEDIYYPRWSHQPWIRKGELNLNKLAWEYLLEDPARYPEGLPSGNPLCRFHQEGCEKRSLPKEALSIYTEESCMFDHTGLDANRIFKRDWGYYPQLTQDFSEFLRFKIPIGIMRLDPTQCQVRDAVIGAFDLDDLARNLRQWFIEPEAIREETAIEEHPIAWVSDDAKEEDCGQHDATFLFEVTRRSLQRGCYICDICLVYIAQMHYADYGEEAEDRSRASVRAALLLRALNPLHGLPRGGAPIIELDEPINLFGDE